MTQHKQAGLSIQTRVAQALGFIDEQTKGLVPPIYPSTTYLRDADNHYRSGLIYSRDDNPTYRVVEGVLADIESGADAMLFGSGMAAAVSVFQALRPGDHVIAPKVMYWALRNWLIDFSKTWGVGIDFVNTSDVDAIAAAIQPAKTKLIWLETPANPMWHIADIRAVVDEAQKQSQAHPIRVAVDSTVATPVLSRPLELGADIVMHSATKYLNGHSDVIAGALICADKDDEFWLRIRKVRRQGGAVLSPQDSAQLLRGMRTLVLRVRTSCESAMFLAEQLQQTDHVVEVLYPGLPSFADHATAVKQMEGGFGGMLSIRVRGGAKAAIDIAARTQLWKRATSLGGVESLIEHRASIEGEDTPVPNDLLRLSVGIEDAQELLADLVQAIQAAHN